MPSYPDHVRERPLIDSPPRSSRRARACADFIVDVLGRIEDTPDTQALRFTRMDDAPVGEILSTGGQLCLVSAEGQISLGARLRERCPESAEAIREALQGARAQSRPLREALTSLGAMRSALVRDTLLDHFAEGLCALGDAGDLVEGVHSSSRRLATIISAFPTIEVYWRAVSRLAPVVEDAAKACFDELGAEAERAVLISRTGAAEGTPLLVAVHGFAPTSVAEIARISRFTANMIRPPALAAAGIQPQVLCCAAQDDGILGIAAETQAALLVGVPAALRARAVGRAKQLFQSDA